MTPKSPRRRPRWTALLLLFFVATLVVTVSIYRRSRGESRISTDNRIESVCMKEAMAFSVYLPPGYFIERDRRYPVVYLFHGFSDNHIGWTRSGNLRTIADKRIRDGKIEPMIVVMPHTPGGFYGNRSDGGFRYEDYFFQELIPRIERDFRVRSDRNSRAVAGISMGGQGAVIYALKYPDVFSSCSSVGGAFHFIESPELILRGENDLDRLLETFAAENRQNEVRFALDCGTEDGLLRINEQMNDKMEGLHLSVLFRTRPGRHDWRCWTDALPDLLEFVDIGFNSKDVSR